MNFSAIHVADIMLDQGKISRINLGASVTPRVSDGEIMAYFINLPNKRDERGALAVIEKVTDFKIERVFYIYDAPKGVIRGGHRHIRTKLLLTCLTGRVRIYNNNGKSQEIFELNDPDNALVLLPEDWHQMEFLEENSILLCLATHTYDPNDYIYENYT